MSSTQNKQAVYRLLIEHLGGASAAAGALGVKQGTASGWARGAHNMSAEVAFRAERITEGKFKAADLSDVAAQIQGYSAA